MTSHTSGRADTTHLQQVVRYYHKRESRLGYGLLLGGTKHFGYYRPGDRAFPFGAPLRRMEDLLGASLGVPPKSRVLDAGCGVGAVATHLAATRGLNVTGVDILQFNLDQARRRAAARGLAERTHFLRMDYAELGFPDGSFDAAYTMETLVHSDRVEDVLAGLYRVLRPGGRLVMFEYSRTPDSSISPRAAQVLRDVNDAAAMPGFQRLHHGLLEQLVTAAGFVDVRSTDVTDRILPMLQAFAVLGWVPYNLARLVGARRRFVNTMSGVEFYRHQDCWRYNVYQATKPK